MSEQPKSSNAKGVILFIVLALPLLGAIVGTPFYASMVQTPENRQNEAVAPDVETVRRAVLNIDLHLAAVKDSRADEKAEPIDDAIANKKDLFDKDILASLKQTGDLLRKAAEADAKVRNLKSKTGGQVTSGPPTAKSVFSEFQGKQVGAHDRMIKDAQAALRKLPSSGHLASDRIRAIFSFTQGQLDRCRGDFEAWQASTLRNAAMNLAAPIAEMRRDASSIDASKPVEAAALAAKQVEEATAAQSELAAVIGKLTKEAADREAKSESLSNSAAEARAQMAAIMGEGDKSEADLRKYADLSQQARQAESQASILINGALVDSKPELGARDLKVRLAAAKEQADLVEKRLEDLSAQQKSLATAAEQLESQKAEVQKQIESLTGSAGELLAEADKHATQATKSYEEAVKSFSAASKAAKSAMSDAQKRTRDAKSPGQDERLQRVAADSDMEASCHSLLAEIAVHTAALNLARIEGLNQASTVKAALATASGAAPPASEEDVEKLKTDAIAQVAEAQKEYELASNLIKNSTAKFSDGSVTGKNTLWQVQMAQAAVHLIHAALLSDKPDESSAAREQAYKVLSEAAKGREQSPLLSSAVETLTYLQQTAR